MRMRAPNDADGASAHLAEVLAEGTDVNREPHFRGGYGELLSDRGGERLPTAVVWECGTGGYYIGGGAELMITRICGV